MLRRMDANGIMARVWSAEGRDNPYPYYRILNEGGPVHELTARKFLVVGYAEADYVLRSPLFPVQTLDSPDRGKLRPDGSSVNLFLDSLIHAGPEDHRRAHHALAQPFTPRRLAAMRLTVARNVEALLDRFEDLARQRGVVDFMDEFAYRLPISVISEVVGVPRADQDWLLVQFKYLADADKPEDLPRAAKSAREVEEYFTSLIAESRRKPLDDLIGELLHVQDDTGSKLTDRELLANIVFLFVAGFETTAYSIASGLSILLERPDDRVAVPATMEAATLFVDEVLRYDPPAHLANRRRVAQETTVGGFLLPEDAEVMVLLAAANRDPARYEDPHTFNPARGSAPSLTFSAGPHYCLGTGLARIESQEAFQRILMRFPGIKLAGKPVRAHRFPIRGFEELPVAVR